MATSDRGTKRTDPETGKKFYDLNKDPVVSPYTGKSYPLSFFEQTVGKITAERAAKFSDDEEETEEEEVADPSEPEIIPLEDVEAEEEAGEGEDIPEVEDVEDVEDIGDDEDDVFLEEEEDADENIGFGGGGDDER